MPLTHLPDRSVVRLSGPDAASFLNGLVTSEIRLESEGLWTYAALLQPQGKILFDIFVASRDDALLIDVSRAREAEFVKRLGFYKLRAKVAIEPMPDLKVAAAWGETGGLDGANAATDPRTPLMGLRAIGTPAASGRDEDVAAYHRHRIGLGIADSDADIGSGELFPHEANLDQLGGVSFTKGCYVGQEVVSRMEHRGTGARNRILPIEIDGPVAMGADIVANDRKIGTVLSSAGDVALALVRLDKAEAAAAAGHALTASGVAVRLRQPPWARFTVPVQERAA